MGWNAVGGPTKKDQSGNESVVLVLFYKYGLAWRKIGVCWADWMRGCILEMFVETGRRGRGIASKPGARWWV